MRIVPLLLGLLLPLSGPGALAQAPPPPPRDTGARAQAPAPPPRDAAALAQAPTAPSRDAGARAQAAAPPPQDAGARAQAPTAPSRDAGARAQAAAPPPQDYRVDIKYYLDHRHTPAPMELIRGIILFQAKLGGRDVWMMLDNGADHSVIDASLIGPLGLLVDTREDRKLRTPTGPMPYRIAPGVPLIIPGQFETRMPMAAVDMSGFVVQAGHPIDGILGGDILHNALLVLDFDKGVFQIFPAGARTLSTVQPVALLNGMPQFDAAVAGKPVRLTIDLGFSGDLTLTPEAWARVAPVDAKTETRQLSQLQGQAFAVDHAVLPQVSIGAAVAEHVGVDIRPVPKRDADGWIGLGLLSQFNVLMDVKGGKLWLSPRAASAPGKTK